MKKIEGEFRNDQLYGYAKFYDNEGKLEFEGDFNTGFRHGQGTEYYKNGQIKSKGGYLLNKYNGFMQ